MELIVDGKIIQCDSVRIIWRDLPLLEGEGEDMDGDLCLACTAEGIIVDVINKSGDVATTYSMMASELAELTH